MGKGAADNQVTTPPSIRKKKHPQWLPTRSDAFGVLLALGIGALSVLAVKVLPPSPLVSDVLIALLIGALVLNVPPLARAFGLGPVGKEREPDRYAAGLRYTGKWILRLSIVLMGMKVQTSFFGKMEITTIFVVAAASVDELKGNDIVKRLYLGGAA